MEVTNTKYFEEEIFSLNYEVKALSEITLRNESERWIPGFLYKVTEDEHLARYEFAKQFVYNKNVLDIACGSGYGSYILATQGEAKKVIGVDLDKNAIRYGNHRFANSKITRFADDAVKFKYSEKFDYIISFETVEHIPNYKDFLINLHDNLEKDGTLIISTPVRAETSTNLENPYHVIEWSINDFISLLEDNFVVERRLYQNITLKESYFEKRGIKKKSIDFIKRIKPVLKYKNSYIEGITEDFSKLELEKLYSGYIICVCKKK